MNQLSERREQLGLSQGELARQAEITRQAVSSIES
ncbi:MAG: helix-turn-helix domain-containing protein, partial [Nitrospiraceae bacterium]|nr:helix-turn-helix domain-containing protein [Nitrospiraceae bacterium]